MKNNPYDRNSKSTCDVCGITIYVDSAGNGEKCPVCGWIQCSLNQEFPDRVTSPNLISLNKAKRLYAESEPFIPDFNDFLLGLNFYGEMEFSYEGKTYGVTFGKDETIDFFVINEGTWETFKDINEFKDNVQINNKYLKNIWQEVKSANWLQ